ncbi:AsmA-like C-terminal region-containing protein, partial [Lutimonas sp.]|uniref:AsmA-like C-terminal region-containing protein n=1 Tax=Lutimonas sp. TaxID=1872403 RepID=UPI003C745726
IIADIKGIYAKGIIPEINAKFKINNGSISYKNQPNKIDLIEADIEALISPSIETGSYVNINRFFLKGVGTEINLSGKGKNLFKNADIDIKVDGSLDMEAIQQSFPFKKEIDLNGKGDIHMSARFKLNDLKNDDYGKLEALGKLNLSDILYDNKSDSILLKIKHTSAHIEQNQNSTLLTSKTSKVTGGIVDIEDLHFQQGQNTSAQLDKLDFKFATTPLKDSTQIAVMKSKLFIDNGKLNLGDSLEAKIKYLKADLQLEPDKRDKNVPILTSKFNIDSSGIRVKGRFFAITKGQYDLKAVRSGAKKWPMEGSIAFDKLVAFTPTFPLRIKLPETKIKFEPGVIELSHAKIIMGNSDIEATGKVYDIGDAFFDNQIFKGELSVKSNNLDINELIQALNDGSIAKEKELAEIAEDDRDVAQNEASTEPKSFVVPENLDLSLNSHFKNVVYKNFNIKDVIGIITIREQEIHLANLGMVTMAAKMATTIDYTSKQRGQAALNFDFKLYDIDLSRLTVLMPVLDSLLPMANSFEGKVNFRMKGATKVDNDLGMQAKSLNAIARIEGDNLVILNGETFDKIAKMLFFKNKEQNTIDKLQFAVVFEDEEILIFPSVVQVDRYQVAIGGQHNLDMSFNYHFSILKSPMPFKAGIDVSGTDDDIDYKITKAKYKYLFSTKERQQKKADSTLIRRKNSIIKSLPF